MSENKSEAAVKNTAVKENESRPYALFLGCTIPVRAQNYELSTRAVAKALGIELAHIDSFTCCGYPAQAVDFEASRIMAARNLALAESKGYDICTICTACTGVLTETAKEAAEHEDLRIEINKKLADVGLELQGKVKVRHLARVLYDEISSDKIKGLIKRRLTGIKLAAHYGCHYVKPSEAYQDFESVEHPVSLDKLIELTGAESIDYTDKMKCCGGALLAVDENLALKITKSKLDIIKGNADAMILVCPFCSVMYDSSQKKIEQTFETQYNLPVLYYPQLLGLAMGMDPKDLGLQMNRVRPKELLDKIEALPKI